MKKLIAIALIFSALVTATACGSEKQDAADTTPESATVEINVEQNGNIDAADSVGLLRTVWNGLDEQFPIVGGSFDKENTETPDAYTIDDAASLEASLGIPEAMADKIEDLASAVHMMNSNTFTAYAFNASQGTSDELANELHEALANRQWLCGAPEKMVIMTFGTRVIAVYGAEDLVNNFKDVTSDLYKSSTVVFDEAVFD